MSRLLNAVFQNDLAKITTLLDRDPRLASDIEALCQGIGWGTKEAVMLLVKRGAELNAKDRNGNHPLNMACFSSSTELFEELIRHGSDPSLAHDLPSHAASSGRTDILRYLYQAGFDLNHPNVIGSAVGMGHLAAVEYLLSLSVDVAGIDVSQPLKPWKGALPDVRVMDEIRSRIAIRKTEPGAAPNVGQAASIENPNASGGPPSVS